MKVVETKIPGVLIIEPRVFEDLRGYFCETYSYQKLAGCGIRENFIQDNHTLSLKKNTIRGLHFQINPKAQAKIVRCTQGRISDIAVDLRLGSPTYLKWVAFELSAENKRQIYIPKGFAHGFLTLCDNCEVQYKVDEYYSPAHDRSIRYDDPEIAIEWGISKPILSEKDQNAPLLNDSDVNFVYNGV
jgi:dTDP-4-dehydrorhamnose 3,5-epimerase